MLFGSTGLTTLSLTQNPGYVMSDFTPVANISNMPLTFSVLASSGITTFQEWMERAQASPGRYNYGSPGPMSAQRLFMETLIQEKFPGARVPHVPYQSGHEANTALLGGQVMAAFGVPGTHKSYLESGEFTLLAVTSAERLPEHPDVPTFRELFGDRYVWESYHGLFVRQGTPKNVIDRLSDIVGAALNDPGVLDRFSKIGITADYLNAEDFTKMVDTMAAFIKDSLAAIQ
jgi:tripartite-type tricarboxylate transporter receptor subunit TctC